MEVLQPLAPHQHNHRSRRQPSKSPVPDSTCLLSRFRLTATPQLSEDKEWPCKCQPPQRLSQIRSFGWFHNSEKGRIKKKTARFPFIFVSPVTRPSTHTRTKPTGFYQGEIYSSHLYKDTSTQVFQTKQSLAVLGNIHSCSVPMGD